MGWIVHQHPDGFIFIRKDGVNLYADSYENFYDDFKMHFPPLPEGADERIYEPGVRHVCHSRVAIIEGGPREWDLGDQIIAKVYEAKAVKAARQAPPPPPDFMKLSQEQQQEWRDKSEAWRAKEVERRARISEFAKKGSHPDEDAITPDLDVR